MLSARPAPFSKRLNNSAANATSAGPCIAQVDDVDRAGARVADGVFLAALQVMPGAMVVVTMASMMPSGISCMGRQLRCTGWPGLVINLWPRCART